MIFAEAIDANTVTVSLRGGVPKGASVKAWVQKHGVAASNGSLVFSVTPNDVDKLDELAAAFRPIVRLGAPRYAEKLTNMSALELRQRSNGLARSSPGIGSRAGLGEPSPSSRGNCCFFGLRPPCRIKGLTVGRNRRN